MTTRLIDCRTRIRPLHISAGLVSSLALMAMTTLAIGEDDDRRGSSDGIETKGLASWYTILPDGYDPPSTTVVPEDPDNFIPWQGFPAEPRISDGATFYPDTNNWCSSWYWWYLQPNTTDTDPAPGNNDRGFGLPIFPQPLAVSAKWYGLRVWDARKGCMNQNCLGPTYPNLAGEYSWQAPDINSWIKIPEEEVFKDESHIVVTAEGMMDVPYNGRDLENRNPLEIIDRGDWSLKSKWGFKTAGQPELETSVIRGMPFIFGETRNGDINIFANPCSYRKFVFYDEERLEDPPPGENPCGFAFEILVDPTGDELDWDREVCFRVEDKIYAAYLPEGKHWTITENVLEEGTDVVGALLSADPGTFAVALLPDFTDATRQRFFQASDARVEDTEFTYAFDEDASQISTTFSFALESGSSGEPLFGLYPHQYSTGTGAILPDGTIEDTHLSYHTTGKGDLQLHQIAPNNTNNSFTITYPWIGLVPGLPLAPNTNGLYDSLLNEIQYVLDYTYDQQPMDLSCDPGQVSAWSIAGGTNNTYSGGKSLGKMAALTHIAHQLSIAPGPDWNRQGEAEGVKYELIDWMKRLIEDWLTAEEPADSMWTQCLVNDNGCLAPECLPNLAVRYDEGGSSVDVSYENDGPDGPFLRVSNIRTEWDDRKDQTGDNHHPIPQEIEVPVDFGRMGLGTGGVPILGIRIPDQESDNSIEIRLFLQNDVGDRTQLTLEPASSYSQVAQGNDWTCTQLSLDETNQLPRDSRTLVIQCLTRQPPPPYELHPLILDISGIGFLRTGVAINRFFAQNDVWGSLTGYPGGFGSTRELSDHHFHYGYFVMAAAAIAQFDKELEGGGYWHDKDHWGPGIDELVRDVANWERGGRDTQDYEYLRYFDPYGGHTYASGASPFGDGNNEESCSESINFSAGAYYWGAVTGNHDIRDVGAMMYTVTSSSIAQYWYDVEESILPNLRIGDPNDCPTSGNVCSTDDGGYPYTQQAIVFDQKAGYSTWFSPEPYAIQGITLLPITPASLHLARYPGTMTTSWNLLQTNWQNTHQCWEGILWSGYAMDDAPAALALFNNAPDYVVAFEDGESKAHTRHWLNSLDYIGSSSELVSAWALPSEGFTETRWSYVKTFTKDGIQTHVAWNPTSEDIIVRFEGQETGGCVPAGKVRIVHDGDLSCSSPGCPGDFNFDGRVDGEDLSSLLGHWGPCNEMTSCRYDLNDDGMVTGADLGLVLAYWGDCP